MSRQVAQYMIKQPISIQESCNLAEVIKEFDQQSVSHLLVQNTTGGLTGIISKNDILDKFRSIVDISSGLSYSDKVMNSTLAKDVMTKEIITLNKTDNVDYAIELLLQKKFHCLPVVENEKPVGVITLFDLLKGYYQEFG